MGGKAVELLSSFLEVFNPPGNGLIHIPPKNGKFGKSANQKCL